MLGLFLVGLVLLGLMVRQVGLEGLADGFHTLGLWLFPYLLLNGALVVLDTFSWAVCFPRQPLPLRGWHLMLVNIAGSAINNVTPTAAVGGEVARVLLLEPFIPRDQATAAVVIKKASGAVEETLYSILGLLYITYHLSLPPPFRFSIMISLGLIALGVIGFMIFQCYGLLSKIVQRLASINRLRTPLMRVLPHLTVLDAHLMTYYTRHPWRFVASLGLHVMEDFARIIKTHILLLCLLGDLAPTLVESAMITVAISTLDQIFFFVPGRIGTYEGARFVVLSALGVSQVYSLAFGLIARVEQLVWSGLGLLAYAACSRFCLPKVNQPVL
jgi:uncharacterized protein (TIRG00374 family)